MGRYEDFLNSHAEFGDMQEYDDASIHYLAPAPHYHPDGRYDPVSEPHLTQRSAI